MQITWYNADNFRLTHSGKYFALRDRKKSPNFVLQEGDGSCKECGSPYFRYIGNSSVFCSRSCAAKKNNFYNRKGVHSHNYGKRYSSQHRQRIGESQKGKKLSYDHRKLLSSSRTGHLNPGWKGGKSVAIYDTYFSILESDAISCRRAVDNYEWLEVPCYKCGAWFKPTRNQASNKATSIKYGINANNLYCSKSCKTACSVFNKSEQSYIKEELRSRGLTFKRDGYTQKVFREQIMSRNLGCKCELCGGILNLFAHHIVPVGSCLDSKSDILVWDIDNGVILCKACHIKMHKLPGCDSHTISTASRFVKS